VPVAKEGAAAGLEEEREGLQNISEEIGFEGLNVQKHKDVLVRLRAKFGRTYPAHLQLALGRMVRGFTADQTAELLEALPSGSEGDVFLRRALTEHLASQDPRRALELGRKLKDKKMIGSTLDVVAQKNGPEALGLLETLSKEERSSALLQMGSSWGSAWGSSSSRFNGSVNDIAELLRKNEALRKEWEPGSNGGMGKLLGKVAGQGNGDPAKGFAELQALTSELQAKGNPDLSEADLKKRVDGLLKDVSDAMYLTLREKSPGAASEFVEKLPESQKNSWLASFDAVSRFKRQGVDAAIEFSEKQGTEEAIQWAAASTWTSFARKDRAAALDWVEALPQGAFREGVMLGVVMDSAQHSFGPAGWPGIVAGASTLQPGAAQVDYFTQVLKLSTKGWLGMGETPAELIPELPLSEAGKTELYRRFAPIKP
jgi:hypothetical protein